MSVALFPISPKFKDCSKNPDKRTPLEMVLLEKIIRLLYFGTVLYIFSLCRNTVSVPAETGNCS